jgi:tetratricopeptide (TPR) repeat protein
MRSDVCWIVLVLCLAAPRAALAQDAQGLRAEILFKEGRELMDRSDFAGACARFSLSNSLEPAVGTLLNLADCMEKRGDLAAAYKRYDQAALLAERRGDARAQFAHGRAREVEASVPRLIVTARPPKIAGIRVEVDGALLDAALLGSAVPTHSALNPSRQPIFFPSAYVRP